MSAQAGEIREQDRERQAYGWRVHLGALAGYLLLALVVTWPTVLHFTTQVPGELIADRNQHYWNFWWITEALSRPANPFHTDVLYYPFGAPLYYHVLGITQWLTGLVPQLLFGYAAAYNTVIIAAFTLSGYAAFRLALYITGRPLASFLGGVIFGFTPYTLGSVADGQNEVTSIQWIPFFAEAWLRGWNAWGRAPAWRDRVAPLVLGGIVMALGAYTTLYYPVHMLVFVAVFIVYVLVTRSSRSETLRRTAASLAVVGVVAALLCAPLLWGMAANYNNPRLAVSARAQMLAHSADLFSFVAFPHDHPILGATRYGTGTLEVRDNLTLGWVALGLAVAGVVLARRRKIPEARFWVAYGLTAVVLAMGPELQIGHTTTGIPLPFGLVAGLPGVEGIGKVERFVALARCAMAVLGAWGAGWALDWLGGLLRGARLPAKREWAAKWLPFAVALALLLVELPLHPRYIEPFGTPAGYTQLAKMPPGGLLELPYAIQQVERASYSMVYQTEHGHPIMTGYLSRTYTGPIVDYCSAFWSFISPPNDPADLPDIVSPTVGSRLLDVLNFYDIPYLALYTRTSDQTSKPVDPTLLESHRTQIAALERQAGAPSEAPFYDDGFVSLYSVPLGGGYLRRADPSLHVGEGWHEREQSGGSLFRWMKGQRASLCVFAPHAFTGALTMQGTAFAADRGATITFGGRELYSGTLRAGSFSAVTTGAVKWPAGMSELWIATPEPPTSPDAVGVGPGDKRPLTLGFKDVRLESAP